jgi:tetratricopeptide (TPR) repeat protein
LSVSEIEELVLSVIPNSPAAAALARRLHQESNGAPAFVADMLRALLEEGLIVKEGRRWKLTLDEAEITRSRLPMPASLRQALQARLEPLPRDALEIARTLAIARRRLAFDALVAASALDEERVMVALDRLVDAGIVDEKRADDGEDVELSHHRLRDVLLEPLPDDDRRARHQRLGEVLERQHRHRQKAVVEELAWHFEQAGLAPKAYAYLTMTATRYLHRSLWEEALAWLDRALALEPHARPLMLLDEADEKRAELLLQRGTALYHRGSGKEARADVEAALALAREVKNARLQARILGELGQQQRNVGQSEEAEATLREALKKAQEVGDDALKPMPTYLLGGIVWGRGDLAEAERLWRDTLATAQRVGDEPAQGYGYNGLGILALCKGDSAEARRLLEQSAEIFERIGMLAPLAIARVNLVDVYLVTGVLRKALMLADRTVGQSREVHHPYGIAVGLAYRASVLLEIGRIEDAWESARESLRIVRELGTVEDEVVSLAVLVRIELARNNADAAHDHLVSLVPLLDDYDSEGIAAQVFALHAQSLAMRGQAEEARAVLEQAEHLERPQWPHVQVRADLAAGAAWRRLGNKESARKVLQRALTVGEANGYRFVQLQAHHELWQVAEHDTQKSRHGRVAGALARSLAASLGRDDAKKLLATAWGGNTIEA